MTRVLTLDLSRKCTGVASWYPGLAKPRGWQIELPMADNVGLITNALEKQLMALHGVNEADQWVYENPIVVFHQREEDGFKFGPKKLNVTEIERTLGLSIIVRHLAYKHSIPCSGAARATVMKHFTGTGNGTTKEMKRRAIVHCQARGWNVTNDNIADAMAILVWWLWESKAQDVPFPLHPASPLFTGVPVEGKIVGNKIGTATIIDRALSFDRQRR